MSESLKIIVAELLEVPAEQLEPSRALAGARLQGSVGRAVLDAAVRRRLGVKSDACYTAKTFGELEAALNGSPAPANGSPVKQEPALMPAPPADAAAPAACGIDIEQIENLPAAADFWSHEFYTSNFTPAEIGYCLMQQSPIEHFAARWCAKEALKKCEPALLNESPLHLEVVSHSGHAPTLRHYASGAARDLPHALSLSHTNRMAAAVVVRMSPAAPPQPPARSPMPPESSQSDRAPLPLIFSVLALLLGAAAILVALWRR